jgi:hypothetical protein
MQDRQNIVEFWHVRQGDWHISQVWDIELATVIGAGQFYGR